MKYKVIELSIVTDEEIEKSLNEWSSKGYVFESIHFVVNESSRRPKMAFLFFIDRKEINAIRDNKPNQNL